MVGRGPVSNLGASGKYEFFSRFFGLMSKSDKIKISISGSPLFKKFPPNYSRFVGRGDLGPAPPTQTFGSSRFESDPAVSSVDTTTDTRASRVGRSGCNYKRQDCSSITLQREAPLVLTSLSIVAKRWR